MLPLQYPLAVFVDLFDPVQRDLVVLAVIIDDPKREAIRCIKVPVVKRDADDSILHAIIVAEREYSPAKLGLAGGKRSNFQPNPSFLPMRLSKDSLPGPCSNGMSSMSPTPRGSLDLLLLVRGRRSPP